jgi:hypothetical protein
MVCCHRTFSGQSGALENLALRETKFVPHPISAVRSFSQRSPQILGIFAAMFSEREICPRAKWRRESHWVRTLSAGKSEALGTIAETGTRARLRKTTRQSAGQRLPPVRTRTQTSGVSAVRSGCRHGVVFQSRSIDSNVNLPPLLPVPDPADLLLGKLALHHHPTPFSEAVGLY